VLEAAVVAVPHAKLGEDVFAFVVAGKGHNISCDELQKYCRTRLSDYKVPRHIELVNALPRNLAGKVLKRHLKEEAAKLLPEV
jgi:acyl-CoA synthetase (AMP-forming)/AMP-acid ligase II